MSRKGQTIAIDFDGVIHAYDRGWQDGEVYGEPVPGAFDAMRKLQEHGYNIVIYTCRSNVDGKVGQWLIDHIPGDMEIPEVVTNRKPIAIAYIDDRGIRFENNWPSIVKYFV